MPTDIDKGILNTESSVVNSNFSSESASTSCENRNYVYTHEVCCSESFTSITKLPAYHLAFILSVDLSTSDLTVAWF